MKRRSTHLSTIRNEPAPGLYAPETPERTHGGMSPCCAKCKTPFGHSALAGICCHNPNKTTKENTNG